MTATSTAEIYPGGYTGDGLSNLAVVLPQPVGYRIIIRIPKRPEKVGSIVLPDQVKKTLETAAIIGEVVALGPDAYKDIDKFPTGPYCLKGDHVMFRAYSGTRFTLEGDDAEYRILNDDSIESTVPDPAKVDRV